MGGAVGDLAEHRVGNSSVTARALLERTAFGRTVVQSPNATQRLRWIHTLCHTMECHAAEHRLDYDGASAALRQWVDRPIQLDPPHPVGAEAVQVLTVHQAKGLELPVVVMWDAQAKWTGRQDRGALLVGREDEAVAINLHRLSWHDPPDSKLAETERLLREAERKRLVYVAATRASDVLVLSHCAPDAKTVTGRLLEGDLDPYACRLPPYRWGKLPAWARAPKKARGWR